MLHTDMRFAPIAQRKRFATLKPKHILDEIGGSSV